MLPLLPQDKANHFVYGSLVFTIVYILTLNPILALTITTIVGFGKEIYDALNKQTHTPDILDLLSTVAGGLFPFLCLII
jgi:hypothetical protein